MGFPQKKTRVSAIYFKGTLRLEESLQLRDGEPVEVIVVLPRDVSRWNLARLARARREDLELAEMGLASWSAALDREDHR